MAPKNALVLLLALLIVRTLANSRLEIRCYRREGNNVRLVCQENLLNGQRITLADVGLFFFNSTGEAVTTLLDDNDIHPDFDSATGILSFHVKQEIEGFYYCTRNSSAGIPSIYKTILAHPSRQDVRSRYVEEVGESVTLSSGVGDGALAAHYSAKWFKDGLELEDGNISRGEDFSLHIASLRLSDSGSYYSDVTVKDQNEYSTEHKTHIQLTVYRSPNIEQGPESIRVDEKDSEGKNISFNCVITGAPLLRVSWFSGERNLTYILPSRYNIDENWMNSGTKVSSTLTIFSPTYEDSVSYECVATILNNPPGNEEFATQASAMLTILESYFDLETVVTEHKQLQLWIELHVPLLVAVRAVVYLTLKQNPNTQWHRTTSSSLINSTRMIFELESHDIHASFREEDFLVQVALLVGMTEGSPVPSRLEEASTSNLNEPTKDDCSSDETYKVYAIAGGCVIGVLLVLIATIPVVFCSYRMFRMSEKTKRRKCMSDSEKKRLEEQNLELLKMLGDRSFPENEREKIFEEIKKILETNRKLIKGDGSNDTKNADGSIDAKSVEENSDL